jgi:hypothetical protein
MDTYPPCSHRGCSAWGLYADSAGAYCAAHAPALQALRLHARLLRVWRYAQPALLLLIAALFGYALASLPA